MEIYTAEENAQQIIHIAREFGVEARIIGHVEDAEHNHLTITSEYGTFEYE